MSNDHLTEKLDAFVALSEPQFAFLINAPWGSGKTHFIKNWQTSHKKSIYVSLFGAQSATDLEEAILQAYFEYSGDVDFSKTTKAFEKIIKINNGPNIDLTSFHRKHTLQSLPNIIIFDDLERSKMTAAELFGAINRYVEHQKKQVILIANEEEIKKDDDYERTKEKLIGRTVSIVPNVDDAYSAFIEEISNIPALTGAGDFLSSEREALTSVFSMSGETNLRILRYALLDFSHYYCLLSDRFTKYRDGMRAFAATFLAMSFLYATKQETALDALLTDPWLFMKKIVEDTPLKQQIEEINRRFGPIKDVYLDRLVLSDTLVQGFFKNGHVGGNILQVELEKSSIVKPLSEEPWQLLWYWPKYSEEKIIKALKQVESALENFKIVNPYILLHIFGIRLEFCEIGLITEMPSEIMQSMKEYIEQLGARNLLPNDISGFRGLSNDSAFGLGYRQRHSKEFEEFSQYIESYLKTAYQSGNLDRANQVMLLLPKNPDKFLDSMKASNNTTDFEPFSNVPFLDSFDAERAADILMQIDPKFAYDVAEELSYRARHIYFGHSQPELEWLTKVVAAIEWKQENETVFRKAQLKYLSELIKNRIS